MRAIRNGGLCLLAVAFAAVAAAQMPQPPSTPQPMATRLPVVSAGLQIKYVRDSAEYAALAGQTYRVAAAAVEHTRQALPPGTVWGVVLDIDETVLDNSVYQLERAAYGLPHDRDSWNAWVERAQAPPVPGVASFLRTVRQAGGRVAFITNRTEDSRAATLRNMESAGLWQQSDLLCLKKLGADSSKAGRRAEVRTGSGGCAWPGVPMAVLAYLGDQMGDFPVVGEEPGPNGPETFGVRYFLLPNPMYGDWTSQVTRPH